MRSDITLGLSKIWTANPRSVHDIICAGWEKVFPLSFIPSASYRSTRKSTADVEAPSAGLGNLRWLQNINYCGYHIAHYLRYTGCPGYHPDSFMDKHQFVDQKRYQFWSFIDSASSTTPDFKLAMVLYLFCGEITISIHNEVLDSLISNNRLTVFRVIR